MAGTSRFVWSTVLGVATMLLDTGCTGANPSDLGGAGNRIPSGTGGAGDTEPPPSGAGGAGGSSTLGTATDAGPSGRGGANSGPVSAAGTEPVIENIRPRAVATDGTTVFWTTALNELDSAPISGGTPTSLMTVLDAGAGGMDRLVYTTSGLFVLAGSSLYRCTSSGESSLIADGVESFVTDDDEVYWYEQDGAIRRMPLAGGAPEPFATTSGPSAMGVHDKVVYFETSHDLFRVVAGADPQKLGYAGNSVSEIAFDSSSIYLVLNRSVLARMPYDGSGSERLYDYANISELQVVGGDVYFLAKDVGGCGATTLKRYRPASQTFETLLDDWKCVYGYVVTGSEVLFAYYDWSDPSNSALYRMPLP